MLPVSVCSWQTGINRVALWSFQNMYSEEDCWNKMRLQKSDIITLANELDLGGGRGFVRTPSRHNFQPIEALVVFLTRMSYPNRWEDRIAFLGGRQPSAYSEVFYVVLDFVYDNFSRCITDITRWAGNMAQWADAIHNAGAPRPRPVSF